MMVTLPPCLAMIPRQRGEGGRREGEVVSCFLTTGIRVLFIFISTMAIAEKVNVFLCFFIRDGRRAPLVSRFV